MGSRIIEFFGYAPDDISDAAKDARNNLHCPFIHTSCQKTLNDGLISGACTLKPATSGPVICCPIRLYANDYSVLLDIAKMAFGPDIEIFSGDGAKHAAIAPGKSKVIVFGKRWGKELRLPSRAGGGGSYYVDWVLALLNSNDELEEFIAVEVQSIDTTGNYRAERLAYLAGKEFLGKTTAGLNWENVSKRILPQLIYKGHVLRGERLCKKGLFFICPLPVCTKIRERLGDKLNEYEMQPGSLTLVWYDIGPLSQEGHIRTLEMLGTFTTTVDQIALAFTAPNNLPTRGVYEQAIRSVL